MSVLKWLTGLGSAATGIAGALIPGASAVLNPISQALGGVSNMASTDDANAANQQLNAQQLQLWKMNNEYNTPANQRARLEAAGYNPFLMSGQISSGTAVTAPVVPTSHQESDNAGQAGAAAVQANLQTQLAKASVQTAQANAVKAQADAQAALANADNARELKPFIAPQAAANVQSMQLQNALTQEFGSARAQASIDNLIASAVQSNAAALQSKQSLSLLAAQVLKTYAETANIKMSTKQMHDLLPYTEASIRAQANASNASAAQSNAQAGYTNTQAGYIPVKVNQDLRESDSRIRKNDYESQGMNFGVFRTPGPGQMTTWYRQALDNFNPVNLMLHVGSSLLPGKSKISKHAAIHR